MATPGMAGGGLIITGPHTILGDLSGGAVCSALTVVAVGWAD